MSQEFKYTINMYTVGYMDHLGNIKLPFVPCIGHCIRVGIDKTPDKDKTYRVMDLVVGNVYWRTMPMVVAFVQEVERPKFPPYDGPLQKGKRAQWLARFRGIFA